jgi:hypothetical protein
VVERDEAHARVLGDDRRDGARDGGAESVRRTVARTDAVDPLELAGVALDVERVPDFGDLGQIAGDLSADPGSRSASS